MTWLIDDRGVSWPEGTHRISRWDAACDPVGFAVSDLGFIYVRRSYCGVTVSFTPSRVGPTTMISAFYALAAERPRRIALSYGGKCPDLEIFGTVVEAIRRIEELIEAHHHPIPFLSRKRWSLDRPPGYIAGPVMERLRAWKLAAGQWTPERQAKLYATLPLTHLLVVRNQRGTDRLVYDHWGSSFDFLGARWTQIATGRNVQDQPFPELGKLSAAQYRRTLADGEPHLDTIDLALSSAGATMLRRRYARLLLPWSEPGGDRFVTLLRFDDNTLTT